MVDSGADEVVVRVAVYAKPGASRVAVGGRHADALIVAVTARAVDGAATEAVLSALADALGVRRRHVALKSGHASRTKIVEITITASDRARVEADVDRFLSIA